MRPTCSISGVFPVCVGLLVFSFHCSAVDREEPCSIAKTNRDCTLMLNRTRPLNAPAIQMYPGSRLTVMIKNSYYFERYSLDYQSGQLNLSPDVLASILSTGTGGLLGPLQKDAQFKITTQRELLESKNKVPSKLDCSAKSLRDSKATNKDELQKAAFLYSSCYQEFVKTAKPIYRWLGSFVVPDSHVKSSVVLSEWNMELGHCEVPAPDPKPDSNKTTLLQELTLPASNAKRKEALDCLSKRIQDLTSREEALSDAIGKLSATDADDQTKIRELKDLQSLADPIEKDLLGYSARLNDLPSIGHGQTECKADANEVLPDTKNKTGGEGCIVLPAFADPQNGSKLATRQVTYAVNALNLVQTGQEAVPDSSKKKTIATITVLYGDSHWEASAGALFSSLLVRSFSVSPVITNGVVTDKRVAQSLLYPTIVPYAAANYRVTDDLGYTRWRSAIYLTVAAGVNPNTVTADFAFGPSLSWRGVMFSGLWHLGHDVRLTQGLSVNQRLGASYSGTATTETYWRNAVALGIAVRIPSLAGR